MYKTALVFYPHPFVGFNKTLLIERHLHAAGIIGPRFRASSAFTAGNAYRQFIPKVETIQRYQQGIVRIYVLALGQWLSGSKATVLDCANLVVVEGDTFVGSKMQCAKLCCFLEEITGDAYSIDMVPDIGCLGIRESGASYLLDEGAPVDEDALDETTLDETTPVIPD